MTLHIELGVDNVTVERLVRPRAARAGGTNAPFVVLMIARGAAPEIRISGARRTVASDRLRRSRRFDAWVGDGDE